MTQKLDQHETVLDDVELELAIEELEPKVAPSSGIDTSPYTNHNETLLADDQNLMIEDIEELEPKLAPTGGIDHFDS